MGQFHCLLSGKRSDIQRAVATFDLFLTVSQIGLPLGLGLCFGRPDLKLSGLWIGILTGSALITLAEGAYCWYYDWRKAVEQAKERQ
jgi:Na+-driven multidrug efflux pump